VSQRFLDQDIQVGIHQPATDLGMGGGGCGNDGRVSIPGQFFQGTENTAIVGQRGLRSAIRIGIQDSRQIHAWRLVDDPQVIPAKGTGADHRYTRPRHSFSRH
jgi:hypothetical protein